MTRNESRWQRKTAVVAVIRKGRISPLGGAGLWQNPPLEVRKRCTLIRSSRVLNQQVLPTRKDARA